MIVLGAVILVCRGIQTPGVLKRLGRAHPSSGWRERSIPARWRLLSSKPLYPSSDGPNLNSARRILKDSGAI